MTTEPLESDVSWQLKKPALLPLLALQLSAWVYCWLLFEIGKRLPDLVCVIFFVMGLTAITVVPGAFRMTAMRNKPIARSVLRRRLVGLAALSVTLCIGGFSIVAVTARLGWPGDVGGLLVISAVIIALSVGPAFAYAQRCIARGRVETRWHELAWSSSAVHLVLIELYLLVVAGPAFAVLCLFVIVPSALVSYGATRFGLAYGFADVTQQPWESVPR